MANNRMYLLHQPSGEKLFLGKRLQEGWYYSGQNAERPIGAMLDAFFDRCGSKGKDDDFVLELEQPIGEGTL